MILLSPPKPVQAATVEKCGNISANETWTSGNVYVITCDVDILTGVTLTIQAGTVVKFRYTTTDLFVHGTLDVQGTAANRVVFTSYKDDASGGDTNGDGTATTPAAGDWEVIYFYNGANTFDYSLVQYGGYYNYGAIYVNNVSPTITNNIIRYNNYYGINVSGGSPSITNNQISNTTGRGLFVSGTPTVTGNTFADNSTRHLLHASSAMPIILAIPLLV